VPEKDLWISVRDSDFTFSFNEAVQAIKFTESGFVIWRVNNSKENVNWADVFSVSYLPNEKDLKKYQAIFYLKKKKSWFNQNLGTPYSEDLLVIPESILQTFYSKWASYFKQNGKFNWRNEIKQSDRNEKRVLFLLIAPYIFILLIAILTVSSLSGILLILFFISWGLGIPILFQTVSVYCGPSYILKIDKMENEAESYFPENVFDYLKSTSVPSR
jgi:hypothetical protein